LVPTKRTHHFHTSSSFLKILILLFRNNPSKRKTTQSVVFLLDGATQSLATIIFGKRMRTTGDRAEI
jgi:hypothetical protein